MKQFKRLGALVLALALVVGFIPAAKLTATATPAVGDGVLHAAYTEAAIIADGELSEDAWHMHVPVSATAKVGAIWDWQNLYLAFAGTAAPAVTELKVNGASVNLSGTAGATATEIRIPWTSMGVTEVDQAGEYTLSFTVDGTAWSGKLLMDTTTLAPTSLNKYYSAVLNADGTGATLNSFATGNSNNRSVISARNKNLASSVDAPTVVEFDVLVNNMPEVTSYSSGNTRQFINGGLSVCVRDEDTTPSTSNAKQGGQAFLLGLCKQDGVMQLAHYAGGEYHIAAVDTAADNMYHFRVEYTYTADEAPSAAYYINGKLIATAEDVKHTTGTFSTADPNIIQMVARAADAVEANRVDVVVTDVSVSKPKKLDEPAGVGDVFLHAAYSPETVTEDGKLSETAYRLNIKLAGSKKLAAVWDWQNLYLGVTGSSNGLSMLKINGVSSSAYGVAQGSVREIKIPLADIGIDEINFGKTYPITLTLDGATWEGNLVFDTVSYSTTPPEAKVAYDAEPSSDGWSVLLNTLMKGGAIETGSHKHRDLYYPTIAALEPDQNAPTVIEYDVTLTKLPDSVNVPTAASKHSRNVMGGGLNVQIADNEQRNKNSGGTVMEALWSGLYQKDGTLYLCYYDRSTEAEYISVALGDYVARNKHHVRIEYAYGAATEESTDTNDATNDNVSAKFFVDGKLVAISASAKWLDGDSSNKNGKNVIMFNTISTDDNKNATEENLVDVTVANVNVSHPQELERPKDLDDLTPEYVFGRIDLNHVQSNLPLLETFVGKSGAEYPLTWIVSDESVVAADGTVTRHATEAKTVTITLNAGGMDLWTVTVTVDPLTVEEYESAVHVDAAFSASEIVVDGVISEEGWRMGGRVLDVSKQLLAEYGFQWNQTTLFAAVDFTGDMDEVVLELNGKSLAVRGGQLTLDGAAVEGAEVAVAGSIVELSVPMSALGMGERISEYGKSMDLAVKAGGYIGAGETLALSGIDWFVTDNRDHAAPVSGTKSTDAEHGVTQLENGWRMYDIYKEDGTNKAGVRSYVLYQKHDLYNTYLANHEVATRIEFDFQAYALPIMDYTAFVSTGAYANSGFSFSLGDIANATKDSWTVVGGIMNTDNDLQFVLQAASGYENILVPLNKKVGDKFSFAMEWHNDNRIDIFVDGVLIETLINAGKYSNSVGNASVVLNMRRYAVPPTSSADDIDVAVTNIAFGKVHNFDDILSYLTFEDIKGTNTEESNVTADLTLPASINNGQMSEEFKVTWTSSNPDVIDPATGKVTQPEIGLYVVELTATLDDGRYKTFVLTVPGAEFNNDGVLHVISDVNPAKGVGIPYAQQVFTLDTTNNSIIRELDASTKVSYVVLNDADDKARLNAQSLTLWVSDDNETYTQVESFKLLQDGSKWYLYDFEAEGQYIKVHYTHYQGDDASFIGAYGQMIEVGYEEVFGAWEAAYTEGAYTLTNDTGKTQRDYAWTVSKADLGITGSDASIRIYLDGELLYHYVDGDNVVIRIDELAAGASAALTVKQSVNPDVLDIANKEAVHEIIYGYVETTTGTSNRWMLTLPAGTKFPDGSTLEKETIYAMSAGTSPTVGLSTDGGKTWTYNQVAYNAPEGKQPLDHKIHDGSLFFDSVTGRIMHQTYLVHAAYVESDMNISHCETSVLASDDGGKTWYVLDVLPCRCEEANADTNTPKYALSYTEAIQLSTYDGAGEGVDFVFPVGVQKDNTGAFACRIAYTKDAGENWYWSETPVTYEASGHEGGCSEGWIIEREDGILVLHVRCQSADADHFKAAYSLDHGITWTNEDYMADYFTTNTQAMLKWMEVNGEQVMTAIWGGNNALGGTSYIRSPLNFAVSANGGDTFRTIQNIAFKTHMEGYDSTYSHYVTNHSVTEFGDDQVLISFRQLKSYKDYIRVWVTDFDEWYTRTKGAYDDFEHGTVQYEGWNSLNGTAELSSVNAQGKYSMKIQTGSVTRSVPYLQDGKVSVDVYAAADSSFTLQLQCAFSPAYGDVVMPIGLRVENGKLYLNNETTVVGEVKEGWNTFAFDLALTESKASVTVNDGEAISIPVLTEIGDYVCYITFGASTTIYVDELLVISETDYVLTASEADEQAAAAVVELIKAIETADDKAAAVEAATEAFEKLNQTQADLVDTNVAAGDELVNYYEVLVAAQENLDEYAAEAVEELINAIGEEVTLESEEAIEAAREAYDALTDEQKELVANYDELVAAEEALAALKGEEEEDSAEAVEKLIDAIGEEVTLESEEAIEAAREAYDALTEEQKAEVTNYDELVAAEEALAELQAEAAEKAAVEAVEEMIESIGGVTLGDEAAIKAARKAYNALTDEQKAQVSNYADLLAAEKALAALKEQGGSPDTGDESALVLWAVMALAAACGLVVLTADRKRFIRK